LDRATSGAIALVTQPALVEPLQRAFEQDAVEKRYLALTRGLVPAALRVDYAIPRAEGSQERVTAITDFCLLDAFEARYGLVQATPRTGRYHQIRRHLAHLRSPIVGDTNYGDRKINRLFRARFGLMRLALHAHFLSLPHPSSGVRVSVQAPLAADLLEPWTAMGLWPSKALLSAPEIGST
jgi:tRNA pseudouridine65 synthase